MEIIIDIPENEYDQLAADAGKFTYINGMRSCKTLLAELLKAIRKGKRLIHCKDCKFYRKGTLNFNGYCKWHGGFNPDEDWYCADGEKG